MSSIAKQLSFLNKISYNTKKAQVLVNPEKYLRLKLTFQVQNHNGHMGARKFWHEYLPTLQFYNPTLQIEVLRIKNENTKHAGVPCTLEVISREQNIVHSIDMRNKTDDKIMDELLANLEHQTISESDLIKV